MPDMIELRTDGPHSPEYTKQVADTLAEAVRVLNYATRDSQPGLEYPGDAYDLLGALVSATQRLPQLTGQITAFLAAQKDGGALADNKGRDAAKQVGLAAYALGTAHGAAADLARALQDAQNAIAGLNVKDAPDA